MDGNRRSLEEMATRIKTSLAKVNRCVGVQWVVLLSNHQFICMTETMYAAVLALCSLKLLGIIILGLRLTHTRLTFSLTLIII